MTIFDTVLVRARPTGARSVRFLVGGAVETHSLASAGPCVLGRGKDANVVVNDPSVSRRHALLTCEGTAISLRDLGSANGTRLGDESLEPDGEDRVLDVGAPFFVGDVLGVVLDASATARARFALGRDSLSVAIERRLAEQRAAAAPSPFAVAALRSDGIAEQVPIIVAMIDASGDVIATSESEIWVLLPGLESTRAVSLFEALSSQLGRKEVARVGDAKLLAVQVRAYPADGDTIVDLAPEANVDVTDRSSSEAALEPAARAPATALKPKSEEMSAIEDLVDQVAATPTSVLILGETGVGKEVLARRIHDRSERAAGPFVALNCAALPETLLESELFGHERGAFTGAHAAKSGLIEAASGGTLFLDELGEMPLATQAKLLRVLEERAVLRVGSVKARPVDLRLLAATNRELLEAIRAKEFRADLYYRLNSIVIKIPPLRRRRDEIAPLAERFAISAAELLKRPAPKLTPEVISLLEGYDWPGNIRELRNAVERLVVLSRGGVAATAHLPEEIRGAGVATPSEPRPPTEHFPQGRASRERQTYPPMDEVTSAIADAPTAGGTIDDQMAHIERKKIQDALDAASGNQTRAAELLGISRRALVGRLEKYKMARPRLRR